jgi:DNA-binding SARP family transcriptional activator/ABC-type branched-subunit amino acid transport system substrate-binding protein/DNA-binding beta-propeller fold protein YncE
MRFCILGPLEAHEGTRPVALGGHKQRALLAMLVLHRGAVVSTERLIDALWGERPPASAVKSVQVYVSQLRKELGEGVVLTRDGGYVIDAAIELDLADFERLAAEGRADLDRGDVRAADQKLAAALALWRSNDALPEFAYDEFAHADIARLEELRLATLEDRIDADLALGRHAQLTGELESLVSDHPLRERLHCQLMLALYRDGRQAEALEAYQRARLALDEVGLQPGRALQELQRGVLEQNAALDLPQSDGGMVLRAVARRGRVLLAGGLALLAAAVVAAVVVSGGNTGAETQVVPNSVAALDPRTGAVVADVPVGRTPSSIGVGRGAVWVLNADDQTVSKIDPGGPRLVRTFATGGQFTDLGAGRDGIWVGTGTSISDSSVAGSLVPAGLVRLDDVSGVVDARVALRMPGAGAVPAENRWGPGQTQIAVARGAVWAVNGDQSLSRIDPLTNRVVSRVPGARVRAVGAGGAGVWGISVEGELLRVDPVRNVVSDRIRLPTAAPAGIAVGDRAVWVSDPFAGTIWRVTPTKPPIARTIASGVGTASIAFGAGAVWAANSLDGTVLRIDPATDRIVTRIHVGGTPREVTVGAGRVWVSVAPGAPTTPRGLGQRASGAARGVRSSACGPVSFGGAGTPQVLIASDLPLQSGPRASTLPMTQAIEFVLARHRFRAGRFTVGYQSCDDATVQAGGADLAKCTGNARAYAATPALVGIVGPFNSSCTFEQLGLLNGAPGGPIAVVSPSNSATELTRGDPHDPSALGGLYPTGVRNYARVYPMDTEQGAADALLARQLRLRRVYVLRDAPTTTYGSFNAQGFTRAARRLGVPVVGHLAWHRTRGLDRIVRAVRSSRADGVFLAGAAFDTGGPLLRRLRAALPHAAIIASDGWAVATFVRRAAGRAADGLYVSLGGVPDARLGSAGQRFIKAFRASQPAHVVPSFSAAYAAQAAQVLLLAIARSDGTRASVTHQLLHVRIADGVLGAVAFDHNGDVLNPRFTILRLTGGHESPTGLSDHVGTTIDRIVAVPTELVDEH